VSVTGGDDPLRVIMLGPPGAGKGTQSARIALAYGVPHIATGEIFRHNVSDGTELGQKAKSYMDDGELVPDDIVVAMIRQRLAEADVANGFVLDGFPRTVPQAQSLEELLADIDHPIEVVLRFAIDDDEVVRRISSRRTCVECGATYQAGVRPPKVDATCDRCGNEVVQRDDDTEAVVRHRLEVYHRQTEPLEFFYWQRGLLRDVEAIGTIDDVTERALKVLAEYEDPPLHEPAA